MVVLEALSRREHFTGPDDLVLCDEVGHHLHDNTVRDEFYAALERAGLGHLRYVEPPSHAKPKGVMRDDPIVFHDLRHTFGTQCAARGIDLRKIQAWMGHADIQTTMRYLHYVPAHDDAARLTAAFTANVGTELATGTRNRAQDDVRGVRWDVPDGTRNGAATRTSGDLEVTGDRERRARRPGSHRSDGRLRGMSSFPADTRLPLTLSEQLDAMLSGWLDRHAPGGDRARPDEIATGVVTVADGDVAQVEAFCARWDLTARRTERGDGRWAVLIIEGRALPVRGFIEITAMYGR